MITDCDDSGLGVYDAAVVVLDLVHAVDDVPLRAVEAAGADDVHLQGGIVEAGLVSTFNIISGHTIIKLSTGLGTLVPITYRLFGYQRSVNAYCLTLQYGQASQFHIYIQCLNAHLA